VSNLVRNWFGSKFETLDPLLQQLHLNGGVLKGEVKIFVGKGISGFLGRHLARKLGIPIEQPYARFRVDIHSDSKRLYWSRCFNEMQQMNSTFEPVGNWPDGVWIEQTGTIRLALTVDVIGGGWYWRPNKAWLGIIRLPLILMPKTTAYKRIEHDHYCFYVGFSIPFIGMLLSYSGYLEADVASNELKLIEIIDSK
jgi:hypothetical protein